MSYIVSILLIHDNDDGGDAMDDLANLDIHLFPVTSYDSAPGHSILCTSLSNHHHHHYQNQEAFVRSSSRSRTCALLVLS